LTRDLSSSGA